MDNGFQIQKNIFGRTIASQGVTISRLFHHFKYEAESLARLCESCMKSKEVLLFKFHNNRVPGMGAMSGIYVLCTTIGPFFSSIWIID
jgi:hypothetical protein